METKEMIIDIPEGYEIDRRNSTFECIRFKKKQSQINIWADIEYMSGVYIDDTCYIDEIEGIRDDTYSNVFISEKYAKAALAMAQFSQLIPYYGGEVTNEEWLSPYKFKYVILCRQGELEPASATITAYPLAFHTKEQLDRFMSFPENIQLAKDFYMID